MNIMPSFSPYSPFSGIIGLKLIRKVIIAHNWPPITHLR
jgi:hypothetical protein